MWSKIGNELKNISLDIFFLFRNFFHWNISKFLIMFFAFILSFLLVLPFLGLLIAFAYMDSASWTTIMSSYFSTGSLGSEFTIFFMTDPIMAIIEILIMILMATFFIIGWKYNIVGFYKMNLSYVNRERLGFFKNSYFNFTKILKFVGLISLIGFYVFSPALIFIIMVFLLFFLYGGANNIDVIVQSNFFVYFVDTMLFIAIISSIYIIFRTIFSLIVFVENTDLGIIEITKESFRLTKGLVIFKFLLYFILFLIFCFLLLFLGAVAYKYLVIMLYDIFPYIIKFMEVFMFLFMYGLIDMFVVSFYKNVLIKNKNLQDLGEYEMVEDETEAVI